MVCYVRLVVAVCGLIRRSVLLVVGVVCRSDSVVPCRGVSVVFPFFSSCVEPWRRGRCRHSRLREHMTCFQVVQEDVHIPLNVSRVPGPRWNHPLLVLERSIARPNRYAWSW